VRAPYARELPVASPRTDDAPWPALPDARLVANILLLALAAAVYPTLLAIVLVVLTRPRPARLLGAYLLGGYIAGLGVGCILVFGLDGTGFDTSSSTKTVSPVIDIVVGALAIALALALASGRDLRPARLKRKAAEPARPKRDSWTKRAASRGSPRTAFVLGIVLDLPSVWYLIALKDIASSDYGVGEQFLLILGFNVIMFTLVEVPLIAYAFDAERAQGMVERFNAWLRAHAHRIAETVAGGIGAYLVVKGVVAI
jgi:threonine/homoserine/homoserine lactone efflux protein